MTTPVISVSNISKIFKLYASPRARLREIITRKNLHTEFKALEDISFEIPAGETFSIIGQNGSGKSTLLQIICGIMRPTSGEIVTRGKIASLLELGAGFNPEFSGRENVFINGAISGIPRQEMQERIARIEEFAEIGAYFDQPVKMYSSGMYVRLAFSAAIHIDPDILVVDEALSVGDARFQKKCFQKIDEFQRAGKTILLVTHDTGAVKTMSTRALLLNRGKQIYVGNAGEAVKQYFQILFPAANEKSITATDANTIEPIAGRDAGSIICQNMVESFGKGGAKIIELKVTGAQPEGVFKGGEEIKLDILYRVVAEEVLRIATLENVEPNLIIGFKVESKKNVPIFGMNSEQHGLILAPISGTHRISFSLRLPELSRDDFFLTPVIALGKGYLFTLLSEYQNAVHLILNPDRDIWGMMHVDAKCEIFE